MTQTTRNQPNSKWIASLIVGALFSSACADVSKGVSAYYEGRYDEAIELLKPFAEDSASRDPEMRVSVKRNQSKEEALRIESSDYFEGWKAYAGSHFELSMNDPGCEAVQNGLRPILVKWRGEESGEETRDPREGEEWQGDVYVLQSWDETICQLLE